MLAVYPTVYRDAHGEEETVIENDGQTLRMVVRGVEFEGNDFDSFTPVNQELGSQFAFRNGDLCGYSINCDIPVIAAGSGQEKVVALHVLLDLGEPTAEGRIDKEDLILTLEVEREALKSSGKSGGFFELEMLDIQRLLPARTYMKCCFNCAFSGYSPGGNGMWLMFCHRNHKEEYLKANDKSEWFRLIDLAAGRVQETYLCPEFQRWNGETGYRDPLHVKPIEIQ